MTDQPFWKGTTLHALSDAQWESLCDGCGRCCLNKLEDWDSGEITWTNVACRLFDEATCRCRSYENRTAQVPDCLRLTPPAVASMTWLPPTCAYRLISEGRDLYWWHPLVSGDPQTVHQAGISVRGRVVSEECVPVERLEDHAVKWPGRIPDVPPVPASGSDRKTAGKCGDRPAG